MKYLYSGKEAKAIDNHAIHKMGMSGIVLMERAAMSVAAVVMKRENKEVKILAVCGKQLIKVRHVNNDKGDKCHEIRCTGIG